MNVQDYPAFSAAEFSRRLATVKTLMADLDISTLLIYGSNRSGAEIQYLTNWLVQREGFLVVSMEAPSALYIQHYNHVPNARRVSIIPETQWAGPDTMATVCRHVRNVAGKSARVGLVGSLNVQHYLAFQDRLPSVELIDITSEFVQLRLVKSAEEIEWLTRAAEISDRAVSALMDQVHPGMTDQDIVGIIEAAHRAAGGSSQVAFIASTPMAEPTICVPAQQPSRRAIRSGDVVLTEISGQFWGYSGQVLRTLAVGAEPTPQYLAMHHVALEAFEHICSVIRPGADIMDVLEAASIIEGHGYGICDDLIHGYGGGYLPPILRAYDVERRRATRFTFAPNMVVVVQPNVVSSDGRMGVQVGEMVRVGHNGTERMHQAPLEFLRCG